MVSTPQVQVEEEAQRRRAFASDVRQTLGADRVADDEAALAAYTANVSGFVRRIPLVLLPRTADEVVAIVALANRHRVPLSPISRGRNWGLGSRLPVTDGTAVLDLSGLDRIRRVDEEFGYAVIEPGVTQRQLADHLRRTKSRFFLDVTGAGGETSIVGNTLERGVAFNSLRIQQLLGLEVVVGSGEILKSGFAHYPNGEELAPLFPYGTGPGLDGLFVQSSFGIVVCATIELCPIQESEVTFMLAIEDTARLGAAIEALRELKLRRVFHGIGRIGNRRRSQITLAPLVYEHFKRRGLELSRREVEQRLGLRGAWTAVGTLSGTKAAVRASCEALASGLAPFGRLRFITRSKLAIMRRAFALFKLDEKLAMVEVMETLFGLNRGVPTDATLHSIHWPRKVDDPRYREPDQGSAGLLFCAPMIPMRKQAVDGALAIIADVTAKDRFEAAVTFNMCHHRALETVISIDFDRSDAAMTARAQLAVRTLITRFMEAGYYPYRIDVENMPLMLDPDDVFWQTVRRIKDALDPNHIIAPGKFDLT
jgi:4-cresol dehydrogenase (hydroxylating) flavoprotein subunit